MQVVLYSFSVYGENTIDILTINAASAAPNICHYIFSLDQCVHLVIYGERPIDSRELPDTTRWIKSAYNTACPLGFTVYTLSDFPL
jgi:hypothetical protein